jgi:hypothetical protein
MDVRNGAGAGASASEIVLPARWHCRAPDACKAAKPTSHCRSCAGAAVWAKPGARERQAAGLRAFFDDPERSAKHRASSAATFKDFRDRPGTLEWLRERMKEVHAISQGPEAQAKLRASAAERGRKRTATVLADIPPRYRDDYRRLVRDKGYTAAEGRAAIAELEAADRARARRAITDITNRQHARADREREQAY